jgi:hypothetical protein
VALPEFPRETLWVLLSQWVPRGVNNYGQIWLPENSENTGRKLTT